MSETDTLLIKLLPNDVVSDGKPVTLRVGDPLMLLTQETMAETDTLLLKLLPNGRQPETPCTRLGPSGFFLGIVGESADELDLRQGGLLKTKPTAVSSSKPAFIAGPHRDHITSACGTTTRKGTC